MSLGLDEVYTLTTLTRGQKGQYATPPPSKPFPLPYTDNFESELWFSFVLKKPLYVVNLPCFLELLKFFSFIEQFGVFFSMDATFDFDTVKSCVYLEEEGNFQTRYVGFVFAD